MKPEARSRHLLAVTRAKAKMYEYSIPEDAHIAIAEDPAKLFSLAIGVLMSFRFSLNKYAIIV